MSNTILNLGIGLALILFVFAVSTLREYLKQKSAQLDPPGEADWRDNYFLGREPGKLRVYVAGSSADMPRVDAALEGLGKLKNVVVTYRWIDDMRASSKSDKDLTLPEAQEAADLCLDGVETADVCWLLYPAPGKPTRGAWVELGCAVTKHRQGDLIHIIVSHSAASMPEGACIFTRQRKGWKIGMPRWEETGSDEIALDRIAILAKIYEEAKP